MKHILTNKVIKDTLMSLPRIKAPGLDGFSGKFFKY